MKRVGSTPMLGASRARASGRAARPRAPEKTAAGEPEDHALGRSRGGFTSKLHLLTDGNGLPRAVLLTAGQRHEVGGAASHRLRAADARGPVAAPAGSAAHAPEATAGRPRLQHPGHPRALPPAADQGGDPAAGGRTPPTAPRPAARPDPAAYRKRNAAERCVGWLKGCRSVGTRFDKLAVNFLAMVKLACVRLLLQRLRPSDRT
jgi:transposase